PDRMPGAVEEVRTEAGVDDDLAAGVVDLVAVHRRARLELLRDEGVGGIAGVAHDAEDLDVLLWRLLPGAGAPREVVVDPRRVRAASPQVEKDRVAALEDLRVLLRRLEVRVGRVLVEPDDRALPLAGEAFFLEPADDPLFEAELVDLRSVPERLRHRLERL